MISFSRKSIGPKLIWKPPKELPNLKEASLISLDLETRDEGLAKNLAPGGVTKDGYIIGIAVAVKGWSGYFSLRHPDSFNWSIPLVKKWFKDNFCTSTPIIGANIKYDLEWLRSEGFKTTGPYYDVQISEPLLNENLRKYNLDSLMVRYLPPKYAKATEDLDIGVKETLGKVKGKPQQHLWKLPAKLVGAYAEMDAIGPLLIHHKQMKRIKEENLQEVWQLEHDLIPLLLDMRFNGVRIDVDNLEIQGTKMKRQLKRQQKKLDVLAGYKMNPNAAASIAPAFDAQGIVYPRTIKTNAPSFTKPWLEQHPSELAQQLAKVRKLDKLCSMFIEGAFHQYIQGDRIYCQFHQLATDTNGTVSGRYSASHPNLQQIHSRDPVLAPIMRSLFIPEDEEDWWKNDYNQMEYRLFVHYAVLQKLLGALDAQAAYINDPTTDFHQWVADLMELDRSPAKDVNFGMIYGQGVNSLAAQLGKSFREMQELWEDYHKAVPFAKPLSNKVKQKAESRGYIMTLSKRRRRFDLWEPRGNYTTNSNYVKPLPRTQALEIYGPNIIRAFGYKALNGLIQGSAADIMKKAMVDAYKSGVFDILGTPSLTVHDELDGSKPRTSKANEALNELTHIMENCWPLTIPVKVDSETGKDWWNVKPFQN
jgi:DNA polymerase I-like protein with 3'-5' exonuclease and polymerase domains